MKHFATAMVALLVLAGCQTAGTSDRMTTFLNMSMAQFMTQTGQVPTTYFPTATGRTYVIEGPTITYVSPGFSGNYIQTGPTIQQYRCRLMLETEPNGSGSGADKWIIKAVNWFGTC